MTLHFNKNLTEALQNIGEHEYKELFLHDQERIISNSCEIIDKYGKLKWQVVDLINQKFNSQFDLYNWLNHNPNDEVAYFLNEAGSNCLSYSDHKIPHRFHLWLGEKGFIIGIEQLGKGFNALHINENRIKDNEGAAFDFFRNCQSEIFFDDSEEARIVYMEFTTSNL
ncbi:MAG: hypothetical protein KKH52_02830 [Nanoarchaeota archaeon]|nr:hypothetical protein [Nanoarchaeota archaeon]MBU1623257.1 hypothetical protein [Nanoarchaeota archaeon]MBU1974305.1 hypothetical protein [Nanoarchaeota archaeon]